MSNGNRACRGGHGIEPKLSSPLSRGAASGCSSSRVQVVGKGPGRYPQCFCAPLSVPESVVTEACSRFPLQQPSRLEGACLSLRTVDLEQNCLRSNLYPSTCQCTVHRCRELSGSFDESDLAILNIGLVRYKTST